MQYSLLFNSLANTNWFFSTLEMYAYPPKQTNIFPNRFNKEFWDNKQNKTQTNSKLTYLFVLITIVDFKSTMVINKLNQSNQN